MRKILFSLLLAVIAVSASAQIDSLKKEANETNKSCYFIFDDNGIRSGQDSNRDYLVYDVPGVTASELKGRVVSVITNLYKSPKDVLTNLGDNIIQLETYASNVYTTMVETDQYNNDILYSIIIQFKDGKVRYNSPDIKKIWITGVPLLGKLNLDMTKPITTLIESPTNRELTAREFTKLVTTINERLNIDNDW